MSRVYGTVHGGQSTTVECPCIWPAVGGNEVCGGDVEVEVHGDRYDIAACAACGRSTTMDDGEWKVLIIALADAAIDNYDGPTDDEISAQLNSVSAAERRELDVRTYMRMR